MVWYVCGKCNHRAGGELTLAIDDWSSDRCRNCMTNGITETSDLVEAMERLKPDENILMVTSGPKGQVVEVSQKRFSLRWVDPKTGVVKRFRIEVQDDGLEIADHSNWAKNHTHKTIIDDRGYANVKTIRSVLVPRRGFEQVTVPEELVPEIKSYIETLERVREAVKS